MIDPVDRFFAPSGEISPGGPSIWHVLDWDQRRIGAVKMDEEFLSEGPAFEHLLKHIDTIPEDVFLIHVSPQGDLLSMSTDPEEDRLGPNVDLVVCPKLADPTRKLVFKYYFLHQWVINRWHKMSLWMRLPKHPNIVPFDKIVVDEVEGGIVGFTSEYVAGGTLEENKTRVFKLKWLHQLIDVVDELNLNLGLAHQDVAPRNLVVHKETDALQLFDFNFSARIGMTGYSEAWNDIKGVLFTMYEMITRDENPRSVRPEEQDVSVIEQQKEWVKHPDVLLDRPVANFREVLREWSERRRAGKQVTKHTDAPKFLDWPPTPGPPDMKLRRAIQAGSG